MTKFSGLIPPMVTPLDAKGRLDKAGVKAMVNHLLEGGVDGIFLLGTTGEGPHLSYETREALVRETCRLVKSRVPVLVGITETNMDGAVAFAEKCKALGASGVVAAPPYYFKLTQDECVAWFVKLADRLTLPLVVYNMPAHTDTTIDPIVFCELIKHKNIVAMKDSSSGSALFSKYRFSATMLDEDFALFMGPDEAMGEAVLIGAAGGVCTGANLWPKAFKAMLVAAREGDLERVKELQHFTTASSMFLYGLGCGQIGFLKGVKAALSEMGLIQNYLTTPFAPFKGHDLVLVKKAMKSLRKRYSELGL